jgi:hypothetical protein
MSDPRAPTPPTVLARARIQAELAALATWGSDAWWDAIHDDARLSPGSRVALLRQAVRRGDEAATRDLFVGLLTRIEAACARWARRVTRSTSLVGHAQRVELAEDLRQELTLHLWDQLALRQAEAWETGFWTALDYASRHVATAYMRRQGLWQRADAAEPQRGPALLLSHFSATEHPSVSGYRTPARSTCRLPWQGCPHESAWPSSCAIGTAPASVRSPWRWASPRALCAQCSLAPMPTCAPP